MHLGWHFVFETLAYAIGFRLYSRARETDGDTLDTSTRLGIIVACCIGAVIGAKILYLAEDPAHTLRNWSNPAYFFGGKTLVGALIGGTISVEVVKDSSRPLLLRWPCGVTKQRFNRAKRRETNPRVWRL